MSDKLNQSTSVPTIIIKAAIESISAFEKGRNKKLLEKTKRLLMLIDKFESLSKFKKNVLIKEIYDGSSTYSTK